MKLRQRIRFFQQLAVLQRAGMPIRGSVTRLKERLPSPEINTLDQRIEAGDRIGEAFTAAHFSAFECHLVAAGERSGQLETVFDHLAEFWKRELEMRQAMVRPLYYPIFVLHLAVALDSGLELLTQPFPVVLVHFILRMAAFYTLGIAVYFIATATWTHPGARRFWLMIPIIGSSLSTAFAYRWITALRLEFGAGISLYRAVGDAWRASGYLGAERCAIEGEQALLAGGSLSKLVEGWRQLPRDWVDFIETGEVSGKFEEAFKNLEEEAQRNWKLAQERLTEWLPKIVYFIVLIFVAIQVALLVYKMEVQPIIDAEKQIDDATK